MHTDDHRADRVKLERGGLPWWPVAAVIGLVALVGSALTALGDEHARELFFRSYLTNFMFFLSLALGGLFFVLVSHLTRAGWNVALRRVAEVVAWSVLPLSALALVVLYGLHDLYEWTHLEVVAHDPLLQHKQPFLNATFFTVRLVLYFFVWTALSGYFLRRSLAQDASGDPKITIRMEKVAAPGMILYALTVSFAAFDLIMSLYPHWYSTIYGVYFFAGCVLGFFALAPIVTTMLQRSGAMRRSVTTEHYHDMGKLMFAFVVFWAYIAFSQYMLIWYGNIPEETVWYEIRQGGPWLSISLVLLVGHFALPFLWLISRVPKRRRIVLALAAAWLLAMHWLDLFYLVMPESRPAGMPFHLYDLTCFIGIGGIFVAAVIWRMGRANLVPVGDPRLAESLGFENA